MISLRPYQTDIINTTRDLMRKGIHSILIQSPTGSGKTLLTAHMIATARSKQMRAWFIVHRRELINQSANAFRQVGIQHGIIAADYGSNISAHVQIASIQTLAKRYHRYHAPNLIVWDECHHVASASWSKIHALYPKAFHVGLTATPQRLDGTGLSKWFSVMVEGPTVPWLIENKFLAPYKLYAPSTINLKGVHTQMGDYAKGELANVIDRPKITGNAIEHYKKYANGKRAVVFAVSREHSRHIVEQFQKEGIYALHVDGETEQQVRDKAVKNFETGPIKILSNVDLFGEGFDVPAMEAVILLRPTQSLGLYLQQIGRSLRPYEGKREAIILDAVGNCERHGLPDELRLWSLDGRLKKSSDYKTPIRICQQCFAANKGGVPKCVYCGFLFPLVPREVEQVDGDLSEVDAAQLRLRLKSRRDQGMTQSLQELIALGKSRGYKSPYAWAKYVFNSRQARKIARVK